MREISLPNKDIHNLVTKDPILGLWHKDSKLQSCVTSFSVQRGYDNQQAVEVCLTIISVLGDHKQRDSDELRQHPKIKPFLEGQPWYYLGRRLVHPSKMNLIQEVLTPNKTSYRPKHWLIPLSNDSETLSKEFLANYGNRAHSQSYTRQSLTTELVLEAKARLRKRNIKPTIRNTAREIGCSRQAIYRRPDLRALFEDEEE
ncbi:MAG: hypothetical protein ACFFAE_02415 [Candidatus Hodarchaeota archaeon]